MVTTPGDVVSAATGIRPCSGKDAGLQQEGTIDP
jgi:hypothetical protein